MTRDEFEQGYATARGTTVERLHEEGRAARPAEEDGFPCDYDGCEGWHMMPTNPISLSTIDDPIFKRVKRLYDALGVKMQGVID